MVGVGWSCRWILFLLYLLGLQVAFYWKPRPIEIVYELVRCETIIFTWRWHKYDWWWWIWEIAIAIAIAKQAALLLNTTPLIRLYAVSCDATCNCISLFLLLSPLATIAIPKEANHTHTALSLSPSQPWMRLWGGFWGNVYDNVGQRQHRETTTQIQLLTNDSALWTLNT